MVDAVKRKAAARVGEVEKQRGEEEATRGDEQARLPPHGRLRLHGDSASAFWSTAPLPPLLHSTYFSGGGIEEESPSDGRRPRRLLYRRW
jgi:hypothetical protein